MRKNDASRRNFIKNTAVTAAGFMIVPRHVLGRGFVPPSDKLNVASIGVGGMGFSDVSSISVSPNVNIVALVDVDDRQAVKAREKFPKAKYYKDFREMLQKENKHIDACTISTPDHTHAVATLAAMKLGKHVYTQKPLVHDIYEARVLTDAAKKYKVITQMGNQGGSGDGVRRMKEWYDAGLIGEVHTVESWTNRPVWPQGIETPKGQFEIPKELDWNLWLGTAKPMDYNPNYLPFNWRGWWNFGTGALGDMACHIMDPIYRTLPIDYPTSVECSATTTWAGIFKAVDTSDSAPAASIIHLVYPRKDGKGDIKVNWYDGGLLPQRPEELGADEAMGNADGGVIFIGTKGKLMCDCYGANPRFIPLSRTEQSEATGVAQTIERVPKGQEGHWLQWVNACIAGYGKGKTSSPFEYAGPFTESLLISNLALRSYQYKDASGKTPGRKKLLYDAKALKISNFDPANQYVKREYSAGWDLTL
jgi:predicted dehydrogenase